MIGPIALVSPRYAPATGGVEKHVEALAQGLARRNIAVEVITTDPTGRLPEIEERDGVQVRRFPTVCNDGVFFLSPRLGSWLKGNTGRFAVIHAHSYHTPLALQAALAGRLHGVPLVLTPHYHGTGHSPLRRALHLPYRPFGHWLMRRAERVICVSRIEERLVQEHFSPAIPTLVLPNGIDSAELLAAQPLPQINGQIILLAVGRLEAYKQFDRLIAAMPHLPAHYRTVIIGVGPDHKRLAELAADLGVADRVRLLGQVAQDDLLAWYRSASVFVSMSQHEAFGITLLEAAVAGAQVLASDIPAHQEVRGYLPAERIKLLTLYSDAPELARHIAEAAQQPRTQGMVGWNVPRWETVVAGAVECYSRAVRRHAAPSTHEVAL